MPTRTLTRAKRKWKTKRPGLSARPIRLCGPRPENEDRLHNLERKIKLVSDAAAELQKSVCGSYNPNRYTVSKKKFIELLARIEIAEEAKEAEHE